MSQQKVQSFLLKEKTEKSYLERLQSLKYSTRENYHAALHRFEQFCNSYYSGRMSEEIIQELKSIPQDHRDDAYFGLLQDFVNWLINLAKYLKPHLELLQENHLVFTTNPNPFHAKMTEIEAFTRYRDRAGLTGKYESTNRHHITFL